MKENPFPSIPGIPVLLVLLAAIAVGVFAVIGGAASASPWILILGVLIGIAAFFLFSSLYIVVPIHVVLMNL